ncbi:MAG: carboxypeptidase-like regulatory domain-containing protein [Ignavibacteriaceae bacterium]
MSQGISQSNSGDISGTVFSDENEALPYANVILKETNNGTTTDKKGKFRISSKAGIYTLEISFIGYEKSIMKVIIEENKTSELVVKLKSTSFEIGTIEVVGKRDFIPITPETKTTVTSSEIEHMQASSLNDVLKLTPGVETTNPTLNSTEKASIRKGDALGTQIILDGIPLTNNANLQIGIGQSTANSGLDLRTIPAENIKEVEIIRGIPSAQYGDFTDGLMIVKTKAMVETPKVKFKYNPQLYEFNLSAGYQVWDWVVNGNLNFASSERDMRVEGDGYTRIAGQLTLEKDTDEMDFKNIFYFTRSFDEYKEKPGYELREAWYNRDMNIKYSGEFSTISDLNKLTARLSVSYTRQNSFDQRLVSRDNLVLSTRRDEGTQEGRIVFGSYLGSKTITGDVWNIFSDVNYGFRFFQGEILHSWLGGVTYRNDFNSGKGIEFDQLFPPTVSVTSPRLRNYSSIPAYNILSFYIEDKITGNILKPFTLQIGARYEVYRPSGFDIKGLYGGGDLIKSYNGSFLNPRAAFSINLTDDTQIRMGFGVSTKSPPMGMIFAQEKYYDIVDTVSVVNPAYPDSNFSLISTFVRQQANEFIKGYKQKKYEVSIDQQFDFIGITLTGYINNTTDIFQSVGEPTIYYKRTFPTWPNTGDAFINRLYLDSYTKYLNNGWMNVNGLEFALSTNRIPIINTVFKFDAAYTYNEAGTNNGEYLSSSRFVTALNTEVMPIYVSAENYSKELLLNYRFEIQSKELGMWLTLHVQQKLVDIDGRRRYDDTLAIGYFSYDGEIIRIPEEERMDAKYEQIRRKIQSYELLEEDRPNKWLINLKVSKSLWKGAAISFYVNNFLNNQPLYKRLRSSEISPIYDRRNPDIFYGIDFNTTIDY